VDPTITEDWREEDKEKNERLLAEFSTRGGIYADEMGLGKTQTVIGLILSRRREISEERSSSMAENVTIKQKRGFEHHPTEIYALEESKKGHQREPGLREVRGTLIFCPGHLVEQWRSEIVKATTNAEVTRCSLIIRTVRSVAEYEALSYRDFVEADVVIASFDTVMHTAYDPRYPGTGGKPRANHGYGRYTKDVTKEYSWSPSVVQALYVPTSLDDAQVAQGTNLDDAAPKFHHFGWHRVVIDEGQECTLDREFFFTLLASYFWYVTGSPFPRERPAESMNEILRLLDVRSDDWSTASVVEAAAQGEMTTEAFARLGSKSQGEYYAAQVRQKPLTAPFQRYVEALVHEGVREHLFWRNTKESHAVNKSHSLPPVVETVEWCVQTDVERALYQAAEDHYLFVTAEVARGAISSSRLAYSRLVDRQVGPVEAALLDAQALCCHPQASFTERKALGMARKSILQIRTELVVHSRKGLLMLSSTISSCSSRVLDIIEAIEELQEELAKKVVVDRDLKETRLAKLKKEREAEKAAVERMKTVKQRLETRLKYLEQVIPKLHEAVLEPCSICWEDMRQPAIGPCAHVFCNDCIQEVVRRRQPCPMCREELTPQTVSLVDMSSVKKQRETAAAGGGGDALSDTGAELTDKEQLQYLRLSKNYGSKMARLVLLLERVRAEQPSFKAIVFSQWSPLLHLVATALKNGINMASTTCMGQVQERNRSIRSFKENPNMRVMLLSSQFSASGLNLTEATHVIMLDVASKAEFAKVTDSQAIARAHRIGQAKTVQVIRLIAKDTIEEQFYHAAYGPSALTCDAA